VSLDRRLNQYARAFSGKVESGFPSESASKKKLEQFHVSMKHEIALEHDPEKACPGLDPGWEPVFRLRETRFGGRRKV
jgi:hypothetical protein